ncbi:MAG: TraR/DksA C4-type zinc finger protein [Planctomycetes bacterium]|nr:TraR/DksA C4-type zinc finger protein [Planctomycetota bacterium]
MCGAVDAAARLRLIGLLRREPDPQENVLAELFVGSAARMTCPICKEKGLVATPADAADPDGDDWQAAVLCEMCREPIPLERLEAIPGAKRCAACQGKAEAGTLDDVEPEYCPQCGAIVEIRVSRGGGITRYKRFCTGEPPCRL